MDANFFFILGTLTILVDEGYGYCICLIQPNPPLCVLLTCQFHSWKIFVLLFQFKRHSHKSIYFFIRKNWMKILYYLIPMEFMFSTENVFVLVFQNCGFYFTIMWNFSPIICLHWFLIVFHCTQFRWYNGQSRWIETIRLTLINLIRWGHLNTINPQTNILSK